MVGRVTTWKRIRTAVLRVLLVVFICIHNLSFILLSFKVWFCSERWHTGTSDLFFFSSLTNSSLFRFVVVYLQNDDYVYEVNAETTKNLNTRNEGQIQLSERLKGNDQSLNRDFNDSKSMGVPADSSSTDATVKNSPTPTYHNDQLPTVPYNFTALVQELGLAKLFEPSLSSANVSWCTQKYKEEGRPTGLLYNKMPKAGSSTTAGVALCIANRVGRRHFSTLVEGDLENTFKCSTRVEHISGLDKVGKLRLIGRSPQMKKC
jgi:hypothetical protein